VKQTVDKTVDKMTVVADTLSETGINYLYAVHAVVFYSLSVASLVMMIFGCHLLHVRNIENVKYQINGSKLMN